MLLYPVMNRALEVSTRWKRCYAILVVAWQHTTVTCTSVKITRPLLKATAGASIPVIHDKF